MGGLACGVIIAARVPVVQPSVQCDGVNDGRRWLGCEREGKTPSLENTNSDASRWRWRWRWRPSHVHCVVSDPPPVWKVCPAEHRVQVGCNRCVVHRCVGFSSDGTKPGGGSKAHKRVRVHASAVANRQPRDKDPSNTAPAQHASLVGRMHWCGCCGSAKVKVIKCTFWCMIISDRVPMILTLTLIFTGPNEH